MNDREVCEQIIKQNSCFNIKCDECPLYSDMCGNYKNIIDAAQAYLNAHSKKENKNMTREEAIIAMIKGEKVHHPRIMQNVDSYYYYKDGAFLFRKTKSNIERVSTGKLLKDGWYIYEKPAVKKWQWAYKSKDQLVHKPRGEVTKHLTEAVAKELYGDDIIKLPFTEIEE